jgi:alkaline phosphatase D
MKIALTSCSDPLMQPDQKVWASIASASPDHLILLGDQIYMDYGSKFVKFFTKNAGKGEPANWTDLEFAAQMYARYAAQWRAIQDSGLWLKSQVKVHGIWDDHDFAWNNSYCAGPKVPTEPNCNSPVPANKQQIARFLFRQFYSHLRANIYPDNKLLTQEGVAQLNENLKQAVFYSDLLSVTATEGMIDLEPDVRLLLTDGRTFRTAQFDSIEQGTILGAEQMDWLKSRIKPNAITLIASGSPLDEGPERWILYRDYSELREHLDTCKDAKALLLSGDLHRTHVRSGHGPNLIEIAASGAARPYGNKNFFRASRGNFALLDFSPKEVAIELHEGEPSSWRKRVKYASIDRLNWLLQ